MTAMGTYKTIQRNSCSRFDDLMRDCDSERDDWDLTEDRLDDDELDCTEVHPEEVDGDDDTDYDDTDYTDDTDDISLSLGDAMCNDDSENDDNDDGEEDDDDDTFSPKILGRSDRFSVCPLTFQTSRMSQSHSDTFFSCDSFTSRTLATPNDSRTTMPGTSCSDDLHSSSECTSQGRDLFDNECNLSAANDNQKVGSSRKRISLERSSNGTATARTIQPTNVSGYKNKDAEGVDGTSQNTKTLPHNINKQRAKKEQERNHNLQRFEAPRKGPTKISIESPMSIGWATITGTLTISTTTAPKRKKILISSLMPSITRNFLPQAPVLF